MTVFCPLENLSFAPIRIVTSSFFKEKDIFWLFWAICITLLFTTAGQGQVVNRVEAYLQ